MRTVFTRPRRKRTFLERLLSSRGAIPWGSDLSSLPPTVLNNNGDVDCVGGATTTAIHSQSGGTPVPLAAINKFDTYPLIMGVLNIVLGATPPSALVISYATTSGTPIASYTVEPGLLVTLAELLIPIFFVGPVSENLYTGAGTDPLIQVTTPDNDVTCTQVGSQAIFQLVLGVE